MYGVGKYIRKAEKRERLLRDKQASNVPDGTQEENPTAGPGDSVSDSGATKHVRDGDKG